MKNLTRTIVLVLAVAYPIGLSAQVASPNSPAAVGDDGFGTSTNSESTNLILKPHESSNRDETDKKPNTLRTLVTVGGSLAVVLGVFFLVVWLFRRVSPGMTGTLPTEVIEVLGRTSLANHQAQLIRCGSKLLLVSFSAGNAGGAAQTLTEITDPAEVDRLVRLCRQGRPSGSQAASRQGSQQAGRRHAE